MLTLRIPPDYAATLNALAADLGQSKVSLIRRAVEHYVSTARPEADRSLVNQLLMQGSQIRDQPHRSSRLRPAMTPTLIN
jgi:hypothetical protein